MKQISLFGVFGLFCLLLAELLSPRLAPAFTYQGFLKENGIPITGTRDMIFSLYSQSDCAAGFLEAQTIPKVPVNNGLFNQSVLEENHYYRGQRLWLRVTVNNTHVSCQEITPVPLAMSLVPNALIMGDLNGKILYVENKSGGQYAGAIVGSSTSTTQGGTGVLGLAEGIYGVGVYAAGGYSHGGRPSRLAVPSGCKMPILEPTLRSLSTKSTRRSAATFARFRTIAPCLITPL